MGVMMFGNKFKGWLLVLGFCFGSLLVRGGGGDPELPKANNWNEQSQSGVQFRENKGQVRDQNGWPRPDVLYSGNAGKLYLHFKNNGISYQMLRVDTWKEEDVVRPGLDKEARQVPDLMSVYRTDLYFEGANPEVWIEPDAPRDGYSNFYNVPEGMEPALEVRDYSSLWYRELYAGIDLHYYGKEQILKYDYHISPGADWRQIRIRVEGATPSLLPDGTLILDTPWGAIEEDAPIAYQNSDPVEVQWVVQGNILSFQVGNYDPSQELVIDPPVRLWGTYYGGSGSEYVLSPGLCIDADDFLYLAGDTESTSSIVTIGSHQTQFAGDSDAFLVKFNNNGVRIWATYYGGSNYEEGYSCVDAPDGSIYLCGLTSSTSSISTTGSHQPSFGGGEFDAFIVKFDASGIRLWATYYGGNGDDYGIAKSVDHLGNVYLAGSSDSDQGIATPNTHQSNRAGQFDAFLAKFTPSGQRLWGTYMGGQGNEYLQFKSIDLDGHIYLTGGTFSNNNISTQGVHQETKSGSSDAFLVKFTPNGERIWGTYFGGENFDECYSCSIDSQGSIFLAGYTESESAISSSGAHLSSKPSDESAFLAKFGSSGELQWGTYYGGSGSITYAVSCVADAMGDVMIVGSTNSHDGIATSGAHQSNFSGGWQDAYMAKFSGNGERLWGTYYGGGESDSAEAISLDSDGMMYLFGGTRSSTSISTIGSHQEQIGGGRDVFLVKFDEDGVNSTHQLAQLSRSKSLRAWPSPFAGVLHFSYELESKSSVEVALYDLHGRKVRTLEEGTYEPGKREVQSAVEATLSSGLYLLVLEVNGIVVEVVRLIRK